jgi:hypothetical protein
MQTEDCVEDRQADEDQSGGPITGDDDIDDGCDQQHDLHEVPVLAEEGLQPGFLLLLGQLVRTVLLETVPHLIGAETALRIDSESLRDCRHIGRVPLSLLCRGH